MRGGADIHADVELIAARNPAGRMHDHRMTDGLALGIKRPLHAQRPIVEPVFKRRALSSPDEAEFETRAPLRMRFALRIGQRDVVFVKRHASGRANERAIDV